MPNDHNSGDFQPGFRESICNRRVMVRGNVGPVIGDMGKVRIARPMAEPCVNPTDGMAMSVLAA